MNGFSKIISVVGMLPMLVKMVESLFKGLKNKGPDKKATVIEAVKDAIGFAELVFDREIVDEEKAAEAIGEMSDAVVKLLNATIWHKK